MNYSRLPEHMRDGMRLYIEKGIPPGSFMTSVLSNDLMGAMGRADHINQNRLFDYCVFLRSHAPIGSFGSPEHVKDWIASGGLEGINQAAERQNERE